VKSATDYVPRRAEALVSEALGDTRVVIINGARQVGKSTLAERVLHKASRWQARFLDDPQTRLAAESDPAGFLDFDGLMLIDEPAGAGLDRVQAAGLVAGDQAVQVLAGVPVPGGRVRDRKLLADDLQDRHACFRHGPDCHPCRDSGVAYQLSPMS
jgi:hypothetical protein